MWIDREMSQGDSKSFSLRKWSTRMRRWGAVGMGRGLEMHTWEPPSVDALKAIDLDEFIRT